MNIFAKKIWQVPIKKHITMFHNQGTKETGESIDRENKTFSHEEGDVKCSTSLNKNTPTKTESTIPVKKTTESRASGVQKSPTEREFPSFTESSSAAVIPTTSATTASAKVSETSNSDVISKSHSRAVTPKIISISESVTKDQLPATSDSITKKTKQTQSFLSLSQTGTATRTTKVVSNATTNNSSRVSITASEEKNNTNNKKTATSDMSSKMPTSIATNRETSLISSNRSEIKTEIKGESKDNSEQEAMIKTEENKKTYALRRSTINSSLTVPWYKRFPPQTPKVPVFDKTPPSIPYPNLCTYPTTNSKEPQGKDRIYSSKVHNLKKGKLQSELGNSKMKFGSVVTSSLVSLKNKATKEKRKCDTEKKVKLEDSARGVKGKAVKTSTAASQGKQSKEDTANKKTKQKLPKRGLKGQPNTKKIVEGPASYTDSFRSSTASFQTAPYVHKQKKPSETFTRENWRSSDDKSSFPSTAFPRKRPAGNDNDLKHPAEKRFNPDKKTISLKLKLDPPGNKVNLIHDPKLKFRQEKKVKLVTPYQILKGKEHTERSTSIILKRKSSDDEKQVRYPYDSKGKLVTPSQILKGKEKVGETSGAFLKKSETRYSYPRCYNEESSSDCLHRRNQEDDEDEAFRHDSWKIVEGPSVGGGTSDKWTRGKEIFEGPSSSGKYEADTTTSTSSCFLERINEEKERRRAKKKEKKAKKMKIRKKKKEKRRKRKERNRGEDEVVTSSRGETDRIAFYGNPFMENATERHAQQRERAEAESVPIVETDGNRQSQSANTTKTKSSCNVRKL